LTALTGRLTGHRADGAATPRRAHGGGGPDVFALNRALAGRDTAWPRQGASNICWCRLRVSLAAGGRPPDG